MRSLADSLPFFPERRHVLSRPFQAIFGRFFFSVRRVFCLLGLILDFHLPSLAFILFRERLLWFRIIQWLIFSRLHQLF